MALDDDSEWEYEYDETRTEDHYMVIELPPASTARPKNRAEELFAAHDPTKPKNKPKKKPKRKRGAEALDDDAEALEQPDQDEGEATAAAASVPGLPNISDLNLEAAIDEPKAPDPVLKIMDLESETPMIMYDGHLYGCQWGSSIGSDMLFVKPPEDGNRAYTPLRSFKDIDLLSLTTAKLTALPATIERKEGLNRTSALDAPTANLAIGNEDVIRQARFLGKIAEIKAAKGEPIGNLKTLAESVYAHPENYGPDGKALKGSGKRGGRAPARRTSKPRARPSEVEALGTPPTPFPPPPAVAESPGVRRSERRRSSTAAAATPPNYAELLIEDNEQDKDYEGA